MILGRAPYQIVLDQLWQVQAGLVLEPDRDPETLAFLWPLPSGKLLLRGQKAGEEADRVPGASPLVLRRQPHDQNAYDQHPYKQSCRSYP